MIHACLAGMLPTLHALWRQAGAKINIASDGCWICKNGEELLDIVREADREASLEGDHRPHQFETYDFVGMYTNIPLSVLLVKIKNLLDLVFDFQAKYGYKSIFVAYSFKHNSPYVRNEDCSWSKEDPIEVEQDKNKDSSREFYLGKDRLFEWIEFALREGYVQFGNFMYRQASGIFMGSSFAPDLANYFGFMHEFEFFVEMIDEYENARKEGRPSMYPFDFIVQYGTRTKRYIDDIVTIRLASQDDRLKFGDIIFSGTKLYSGEGEDSGFCVETFGGMYAQLIRDFNNDLVPTTIALTVEQQGPSVHFLDMEVVPNGFGKTDLKIYDKRDGMPVLASYRKFPHVETKLSEKCLYAVFHSQLCRFASRCTRIEFFESAAAKLMASMCDHSYDPKRLSNKLHSFSRTFFRKTPIYVRDSWNPDVRKRFWNDVQYTIEKRVHFGDFD